jgi:uncharacterized membrane protein
MTTSNSFDTRKLVLLALLTAIVVVLQLPATMINFGAVSITLVLMPIAIGAALIGVYAGAWLGLVFGVVVLIYGQAGLFLALNPVATVAIVLLKGMFAGLAAGAVYKAFENRNKTLAAMSAAAICPIVNTGIFLIGFYLFFAPTFNQWGPEAGLITVTAFVGLSLLNFLFELALNLVLSPVIVRLIQYRSEMKKTTA